MCRSHPTELTFNDPGEPTTPFDPGFTTGDPFTYLGPVSPPGDAGISPLVPGTVYYVITTNTPGVIELATSNQNAQAGDFIPISLPTGSTTTNINYSVPFTPADTRTLVVTQFEGIDTSTMSFTQPFTASPTTLTPLGTAGVNINAMVNDDEYDFVASGIGTEPGVQDEILRPELVAPQTNAAIKDAWNSILDSGSKNSVANSSPATTVTKDAPGSTGTGPDLSFAGAVFVEVVPVDIVTAEVGEHGRDRIGFERHGGGEPVADDRQLVDGLGYRPGWAPPRAAARARRVRWRWVSATTTPSVHASIDSGAQIDAGGTLAVTATTQIPFEIPHHGQRRRWRHPLQSGQSRLQPS